MVKVKVTFGSNSSIEAEANNPTQLAEIVDRYIQKFYPNTIYNHLSVSN